MLWLDSKYPTDGDASKPGVLRGTCATDSGKPSEVEVSAADATVTYSASPFVCYILLLTRSVGNIKVGDIGSTYGGSTSTTGGTTSTGGSTTTTTSGGNGCTVPKWGQ